jgi:hypothetical protein
MIANRRHDPGGKRPPADHPPHVGLVAMPQSLTSVGVEWLITDYLAEAVHYRLKHSNLYE